MSGRLRNALWGAALVAWGVANAGGIPAVPPPTCVANCPGDSSGSSDTGTERQTGRGIWGWIDIWKARSEAAAAERRKLAHQQNEQGVAAFKRGDYAEALRLQRLALEGDPDNAVIRKNVASSQAEVARQERDAEAAAARRRAQSEYGRRMQQVIALMPVIQTAPPGSAGKPTRLAPKPVPFPGVEPDQWQVYLADQATVERLQAKLNRDGVLSDADASTFYAALSRRNSMWTAVTLQPLDGPERDRVRLPLPVVVSKALLALPAVLQQLQAGVRGSAAAIAGAPAARPATGASALAQDPNAGTNVFVANFLAEQGTTAIETGAGDAVAANLGEGAKGHYEGLVALGRIAIKAREGGAPAAGAETADLTISRIPGVTGARAQMAVSGGRIVAKIANIAEGRFITEMDSAIRQLGGRINSEDSFARRYEDASAGQKAMIEWIGGGK